MALTTVPLLREDSILAWDLQGASGLTRGAAGVSAASTWQSFGRVMEWTDMGPQKGVYRDAIAGAGPEAHVIGIAGTSYKPYALGPLQVNDPRVMALAWGREVNAPASLGGGFYRHTASPTNRGALPYFSVQAGDYKAGTLTDGFTYLDCVMPRLSVRGEEPDEEGSENTGRILIAPTIMPHDHSSAIAAKGVSLPTTTPYYKQHASIQFYNSDVDWRIKSWEYTRDSHAAHHYYHTNTQSGKPFEGPPQGILHDLMMNIVADGHTSGGNLLRDLAANEVLGQGQIKYVRTANQDEWAINLTDIQINEAPKERRAGPIAYNVDAAVRATTFEWVDQNSSRYLPS